MKGWKWNTRKKEFVCQQCGKKVIDHISRKMKFCSKDCMKKSGVFTHRNLHTQSTKDRIAEKKRLNPTGFKKGHSFIAGGEKGWFKKGMKPWNFQGGTRTQSQILKDDVRWKKWRQAVFSRDNWTCQGCGKRGSELHPHHIKSKVAYPDLAYEVSNGMTLCIPCHKKTDNYGGKALRKK